MPNSEISTIFAFPINENKAKHLTPDSQTTCISYFMQYMHNYCFNLFYFNFFAVGSALNFYYSVESRVKKLQDSYLELLHLGMNGPLGVGFLVVRE